MMWSISLFIFKFYGPALLSSTEDAGAEAYVFALPVGHILGCLLVVFSRTRLFVRFPGGVPDFPLLMPFLPRAPGEELSAG